MANWTRRGFLGSLSGVAAATSLAAQQRGSLSLPEKRTGHGPIKITDLRCAIIGQNPVIRIVTDQGVSGYGQAESTKPYLKPMVLFYKNYILGEDPTDVDRVMLKIRRIGGFKPWGSAVSAIEIALWDIAGQVAQLDRQAPGEADQQARGHQCDTEHDEQAAEGHDLSPSYRLLSGFQVGLQIRIELLADFLD